MIPGLAGQIVEAVDTAVRTVMLEREANGRPNTITEIAREISRNAAGTIVLQLENTTEELADARSNINEATKALDVAGVAGAGDLAERIRKLGSTLVAALDFIDEINCDGCSYGDNCPDNAGTRHGTCGPCKARREAARLRSAVAK